MRFSAILILILDILTLVSVLWPVYAGVLDPDGFGGLLGVEAFGAAT